MVFEVLVGLAGLFVSSIIWCLEFKERKCVVIS